MPVPLRVVVAAGCATCRRARELVDAVRRLRPDQPVELLDAAGPVPAGIVGTPTYLLGEQVVSLGNPTLDALLATLDGSR